MKRVLILLAMLGLVFGVQAQSNQLYRMTAEFPKYVTAHVEFRDATAHRWPSFFYGKPGSNGVINLGASQPAASFALHCTERPQKNGDQSRRVLGELFPDAKPGGVVLQINSMSALTKGADTNAPFSASFVGVLNVVGKKVPVNASGTLRMRGASRTDEKNESLSIDLRFDIKASDLGLKTFEANAPIQVRAAVTAYPDSVIAAAASRRR